MVVYLDTLILDNFCADAALLYCAVKTVKGEAKLWRIFLTALFGTALAVGYTVFKLYYTVPAAVDILVKYGVAAVLPLPAAKFKKKRTYALCSLAFVGYMFALAGMLTALFAQISPNEGEGELTYTLFRLPSGVLVAGCVLVVVFGIRFAKMLTDTALAKQQLCTDINSSYEKDTVKAVSSLTASIFENVKILEDALSEAKAISDFEASAFFYRDRIFPAMTELRAVVDELETITDASMWPYPSYGELLFGII